MLDRVHLAGTISRTELAKQTGLNRSTIRDLLGELTELGLVVEDTGITRGSPGRPSAVARARPSGAVVLAVELEVDFTAAATIGLGGHIFDKVRVANPIGAESPEAIIDMLAELVAPLLAALPPGHNLVGVGAAAAGLVRRADGYLSVSPNRGWRDAPLGEMIARSLGIESGASRQRGRRQRARRVPAGRSAQRAPRDLRRGRGRSGSRRHPRRQADARRSRVCR